MIRTVTVINHLGESLKLELSDPASSGFEVHSIDGLGPPQGTINTSKMSTMDGVRYNSATVAGRNVVLTLGFLDSPSVEEVRQRSYRYFPVKKDVTLLIESDLRTVTTYGYVESNAPVIFSKDKETTISIVCPDAYLLDASENRTTVTEFFATEKNFEFPFSNESLTDPLLEFGIVQSVFEKSITYEGDAEVGIDIKINFFGPVVNPIIYNPQTNEAIRIDNTILNTMIGTGLVAGDEVRIRTSKGKKGATLLRNGVTTNILNALGRDVDWLQFTKGINVIAYTATSGVDSMSIRIENNTLYEGV